MLKRKGISPVIAVVALLFVTVAAVTILLQVLPPYVANSLEESTECLDYRNYFKFDESLDTTSEDFNCKEGNDYKVSVKVGDGSEDLSKDIKGFRFVFRGVGASEPIEINETTDCSDASNFGITSKPACSSNLVVSKPGETRTYIYSSTLDFDSVDIHPELKSGGSCERSDMIRLILCS